MQQPDGGVIPALRWSATRWRAMEKIRDQIMFNTGTDEPWYLDKEFLTDFPNARSANWRKPLRIDEVNQMAPTPEVRARQGRG
jgi:hypothetical protein